MATKTQYVLDDAGLKIKVMPVFKETDYERFWSKAVITANPEICWIWTAEKQRKIKKPYGIFYNNTIAFTASRVAYFLHFKKDPLNLHVLHKCDNHSCVNPNHLFLGTNNDNVQDKMKKGRQAKNVAWCKGIETKYRLWDNRNCNANKNDFEKMKGLYLSKKESVNSLSVRFGVGKPAVAAGLRKLGVNVPKIHCELNEKQVLEIRSKYDSAKRNGCKLAAEYNIGKKTIMDIVRRKTWKHLK